jgi:NADH:ubiquinone oxidoreductase subunit 4 (chain M)
MENLSDCGLDRGSWDSSRRCVHIAALKLSFFGEKGVQGEVTTLNREEFNPITIPEKIGACMLMLTTLAVGVYPKLLLDRIMPAVETMRFLK